MEERDPSFSDIPDFIHNQKELQQALPIAGTGTYIVQIPKNQIYRVPPPENALIIERHHQKSPVRQQNLCLSWLIWFVIIIGIVALALGVSALIIFLAVRPKNPIFSIKTFDVKQPHNQHHHPQYFISLKSQNPNDGMGIFYEDGGAAHLSYQDQEIGSGNLPTLYQGYNDLKTFHLNLPGASIKLPRQIQKSMKANKTKVAVPLSFSVDVPVKMRIGILKTWDMNMNVNCDFRVNTLTENIHVLSQKCDTVIH